MKNLHDASLEDGYEEDPMYDAVVFDTETVSDPTIICDACDLFACVYWHSPGQDDCYYCLDCSAEDECCKDISSDDAEDLAHWELIMKFCMKKKSKKRRK